MSGWIDEIKKRDEQQQEAANKINAIRIHNAKIIHAKAPALWAVVIAQITSDLKTLRETFPNDLRRQGDLISRGNSHTLQSKKLPFSIMELTLNLDAGHVDVLQGSKKDRIDQPILVPKEPIQFTVQNDEQLTFIWKDHHFSDPAHLSEQLIKYVCGLQ